MNKLILLALIVLLASGCAKQESVVKVCSISFPGLTGGDGKKVRVLMMENGDSRNSDGTSQCKKGTEFYLKVK
jgi:hypothetical protein